MLSIGDIRLIKKLKKEGLNISVKRVVMSPGLLVIDEIGYFPMNREDANHFFQVVSRRYERGSVITIFKSAF